MFDGLGSFDGVSLSVSVPLLPLLGSVAVVGESDCPGPSFPIFGSLAPGNNPA